jgi:hypothetical protein
MSAALRASVIGTFHEVYQVSTANNRQVPGTPFNSCSPRSENSMPIASRSGLPTKDRRVWGGRHLHTANPRPHRKSAPTPQIRAEDIAEHHQRASLDVGEALIDCPSDRTVAVHLTILPNG